MFISDVVVSWEVLDRAHPHQEGIDWGLRVVAMSHLLEGSAI